MSYFEKPAPASRRRFWLWLLGGAVAIALLWPLDGAVDAALDVTTNPKLQPLASWCSKIGEGWVVAVGCSSFAVLFLLLHRPQLAARIFFVGMVSLLTGLVADIFRVILGVPVRWHMRRRDFMVSGKTATGSRVNLNSAPFHPATPPRRLV